MSLSLDTIKAFLSDASALYPKSIPVLLTILECPPKSLMEGGFPANGWLGDDGVVVGALSPILKEALRKDYIVSKLAVAFIRMVFFEHFIRIKIDHPTTTYRERECFAHAYERVFGETVANIVPTTDLLTHRKPTYNYRE